MGAESLVKIILSTIGADKAAGDMGKVSSASAALSATQRALAEAAKSASAAFDQFSSFASSAGNSVLNFYNSAVSKFSALPEVLLSGMIGAIASIMTSSGGVISNAINKMANSMFSTVGGAVNNGIKGMEGTIEPGLLNIFKNITGKIETGINSTMASISTGIGGAVRSMMSALAVLLIIDIFKKSIDDTLKWTEAVVDLGRKMQITTAEASYYKVAMDEQRVSADALVAANNTLGKTLINNEDYLKNMGIITRDADGNLRSTAAILPEVNSKILAMSTATEKNTAASTVYEQKWNDMDKVMKINITTMASAKRQAESLGLVIGDKQVEAAEKYRTSMATMKLTTDSLKISVGNSLLPIFSELYKLLSDFGKIVAPLLSTAFGAVLSVLKLVGLNLAAMAITYDSTFKIFSDIFSGNFNKIKEDGKVWLESMKAIHKQGNSIIMGEKDPGAKKVEQQLQAKTEADTQIKNLISEIAAKKEAMMMSQSLYKQEAEIKKTILAESYNNGIMSTDAYYFKVSKIANDAAREELKAAETYLEQERGLLEKIAEAKGADSVEYQQQSRIDVQAQMAVQNAQLNLKKTIIETGIASKEAARARDQEYSRNIAHSQELTGEYVNAEQTKQAAYKLTSEYLLLQKEAIQYGGAAAQSFAAQELIDQQKILEAKRKELELETTHQSTLLQIEASKKAALGYDQNAIDASTGYKQALNEELILMNQIATEINPKRAAQMQEQLEQQQSLNRLLKNEAEYKELAAKRSATVSAANDAIKLGKAAGEDTSRLANIALMTAYDAKRAEYQHQIAQAQETGNMDLSTALGKASSYLDQLYSQRDVSAENLKILQDILGVQSGITDEAKKQSDFGGGKAATFSDGSEMSVSTAFDPTDANDKTLLKQIYSNMVAVMGSGLDGGYGMSLWKQYLAEGARLQELVNKEYAEQIAAELKIAADKLATAGGDLSTAATDLAKTGQTLADALHASSLSLTNARISIAGSGTSTLTPLEQYNLAKQSFLNTAAQAQSTGDVDLFNQLPELAKAMLTASQSYNASGTAFTADYNTVQSVLAESAISAETAANNAETIIGILQQQAALLEDIKTRLSAGSDITNQLASLNTINGTLNATMGTVNTSVGATTAAAQATANATGQVVTGVANNGTLTSTGTNTLASWLSNVNTQAANTASYTATTKTVMQSSLLASQNAGRVAVVRHRAAAGGSIATNADDTYTYYKYGGIANDPTGRSIFGEAGPEAAVPLPDGRTIPVTLYGNSDNYKLDLSGLITEVKNLRAEVAGLRKQQANETDEIVNASGKVAQAVNGNAAARVRY